MRRLQILGTLLVVVAIFPSVSSQAAWAAGPTILKHDRLHCVAISPDGRWLLTGGYSDARLWDLSARDPASKPKILWPKERISSVAISPDGRRLAAGGWSGTARAWEFRASGSLAKPKVLRGHDKEATIADLAFTPDGRRLVTGSWDSTARVWDLSAADPCAKSKVLRGHDGNIYCLAISPDGRWLATGSSDKTARLWDLSAADPSSKHKVLRGHEESVNCLAISPDGRWLATGSTGGFEYDSSAEQTLSFALWMIFRHGIGGHSSGTARVWDLSAANPSAEPKVVLQRQSFSCVAFTPDSRWLVTGSWRGGWWITDDIAGLWDLSAADPSMEPRLLRGLGRIDCLVISRDGWTLVTGGESHTAEVWDLAASDPGDQRRLLRGHKHGIRCLAISPDGRWLVTGSHDTARVWDLSAADPAPE